MAYAGPNSLVQPVGHKVGLTGNGSTFVTTVAWTLTRYQHTMAPQGASDIQLVYGNFSGAAVPEQNTVPLTVAGELEYGGICYPVTFSAYPGGTNPGSAILPAGSLVISDPVPVYIPPAAVYYTRTLTVGSSIPAARNTLPQLGEMGLYGSGTAPQTPLGAHLTTTAATAVTSTTLTFSATSLSGFGGAALSVGAQLRGPGILPGTTVAAFTGTTITMSQTPWAAIASGAVIHIYANRPFNSFGGFGPANVLGRVKARPGGGSYPAALIFGDSIAAGKWVSGTLATNAAAASGQNVLPFASTTLASAIMFPGLDVPAWQNPGVPAGTVVGSFTATSVTLVTAASFIAGGTPAAANLTAAIASGTTVTFGQQGDLIGNSGYLEKGLVTGFGTTAPVPALPWCNMAVSGDTLFNFFTQANGQCRMKLLSQGFTHAIDEYGINDFASGLYASFAAFQAAKLAFWTLLASYGLKVVACTILSETTSTDGWITTANQTSRNGNFAAGGMGQQYNDWIRTLVGTVLWGVIDAADAQMSARDSQLWTTATIGGVAYPMTVRRHPPGRAGAAGAVGQDGGGGGRRDVHVTASGTVRQRRPDAMPVRVAGPPLSCSIGMNVPPDTDRREPARRAGCPLCLCRACPGPARPGAWRARRRRRPAGRRRRPGGERRPRRARAPDRVQAHDGDDGGCEQHRHPHHPRIRRQRAAHRAERAGRERHQGRLPDAVGPGGRDRRRGHLPAPGRGQQRWRRRAIQRAEYRQRLPCHVGKATARSTCPAPASPTTSTSGTAS